MYQSLTNSNSLFDPQFTLKYKVINPSALWIIKDR